MSEPVIVKADDVCKFFDRVSWSLIEEPDICELCNYYEENGSLCRCEANSKTE